MNKIDREIEVIKSEYNQIDKKAFKERFAFIENLMLTERFFYDFKMTLFCHFEISRLYFFERIYNKAMYHAQKSVEIGQRAKENKVICQAYNYMGIMYRDYGIIDRSLEMYISMLEISKEMQDKKFISIAANNIGDLYDSLGNKEKMLFYYKFAYNEYLDYDKKTYDEQGFMVLIQINLTNYYAEAKDLECAYYYYNMIDKNKIDQSDDALFSIIEQAKMRLCFLKDDYLGMDKAFLKSVNHCKATRGTRNLLSLSKVYVSYCIEKNHNVIETINEIRSLIFSVQDNIFVDEIMGIYDLIVQFYLHCGDLKKLSILYDEYIDYSFKYSQLITNQHLSALDIQIESNDFNRQNQLIEENNALIRKLTKEIEANSLELESKNMRVKHITEVGKKLTASLKLVDIVHDLHEIIAMQMKVDVFDIFIEEEDYLKSVIQGIEKSEYAVKVGLGTLSSPIVKSFKHQETYVIHAKHENTAVDIKDALVASYSSQVFMPLMIGKDSIGVMVVMAHSAGSFSNEDIDLLRALSSYLAVAVNNAKRSEQLKSEAKESEKTQMALQKVNAELKVLAERDFLTHIYNRRKFDSEYIHLYNTAISQGRSLGIIIIDIDYFKLYNDTYGHLRGDAAIISIAKKLNSAFLGKNQIFARYGGEEFVAVILDIDLPQLNQLSEQLRVAVSEMGIVNEHSSNGFLTVSIGGVITLKPEEFKCLDLLNMSDKCLYEAKENGRNCVKTQLL